MASQRLVLSQADADLAMAWPSNIVSLINLQIFFITHALPSMEVTQAQVA